jgi:hypothetical protein
MIATACPRCFVRVKAPDAAAGRVVRCPRCKEYMCVPVSRLLADDGDARPSRTKRPPAGRWNRTLTAVAAALATVVAVLLVVAAVHRSGQALARLNYRATDDGYDYALKVAARQLKIEVPAAGNPAPVGAIGDYTDPEADPRVTQAAVDREGEARNQRAVRARANELVWQLNQMPSETRNGILRARALLKEVPIERLPRDWNDHEAVRLIYRHGDQFDVSKEDARAAIECQGVQLGADSHMANVGLKDPSRLSH